MCPKRRAWGWGEHPSAPQGKEAGSPRGSDGAGPLAAELTGSKWSSVYFTLSVDQMFSQLIST